MVASTWDDIIESATKTGGEIIDSAMDVQKTALLGNEYDERVRSALRNVLQRLGARVDPAEFGMGGSQELLVARVHVRDRLLAVQVETYVGLSISGDAALVDQVALLVRTELEDKR